MAAAVTMSMSDDVPAVPRLAEAVSALVHRVERRAAAPAGDLTLADGRILTRRGPHHWFHAKSKLTILAAMEPYLDGRHGELLHVSCSYPNRLPGWKDLKLIKAAFFGPDVSVMIVLPIDAEYTNVHPFCHHLWQMPEPWSDDA